MINSKTFKNFMIWATLGAVTLAGGMKLSEGLRERHRESRIIKQDSQNYGNAVLGYIFGGGSINKKFTKQITGTNTNAKFYDLNDGKVYFSIDKEKFNKTTLEKLTLNPEEVEFGTRNGEEVFLGDYKFADKNSKIFRFASENFRINKENKIKIDYGNITYDANSKELASYIENEKICGGNLTFKAEKNIVIANHGAFVLADKEASLERLVNQIINKGDTNKIKSQKLLEFVTSKIKYDQAQSVANYETLKRPNEVLMTKTADCSGKSILYASLLKQAGIDCKLIYMPSHITIATEGNFKDENNLEFNYEGKSYSIAETTIKGFEIGGTRINYSLGDIIGMQKPSKGEQVYNFKTGEPMKF